MAIIRFGGGIADARGSIGGTTFSRNGSGPLIRQRTAGVQPRSTNQHVYRSRASDLAKRFSASLTDAQRASWRSFAQSNPTLNRFGNTLVLSAIAMYTKLNSIILLANGLVIDDPPPSLSVSSPTALSISAASGSPGSISVTITDPSVTADELAFVWVTSALPSGRSFVSTELRYTHSPNADGLPHDITFYWSQIFGNTPTAPGQKIFVRAAIGNVITGALSPFLQASTTFT